MIIEFAFDPGNCFRSGEHEQRAGGSIHVYNHWQSSGAVDEQLLSLAKAPGKLRPRFHSAIIVSQGISSLSLTLSIIIIIYFCA